MSAALNVEDQPQLGWSNWLSILLRVKSEVSSDHVGLISAGVAFYGLLALFPATAAILSIGGLFLTPEQLVEQMAGLSVIVPDAAMQIIRTQAASVAGSDEAGLGLSAVLGIVIALYSASKGMASLIEGMNVAYDLNESRGFIRRKLTVISLTILAVVGLLCGLFATIVVPLIAQIIPAPAFIEVVLTLLTWLVLVVLTVFGLNILYRFGPDHPRTADRTFRLGAIVACVLWLAGSAAFAIYVANFASYNETFGALAGVVVLLTWLWLSSFIALLGAELNAEIDKELGVVPSGPPGSADGILNNHA